jgi:hypothetical protein
LVSFPSGVLMPALTRNSFARSGVSCLIKVFMSEIFFCFTSSHGFIPPVCPLRIHSPAEDFNQTYSFRRMAWHFGMLRLGNKKKLGRGSCLIGV